jgi:hypothetical protein
VKVRPAGGSLAKKQSGLGFIAWASPKRVLRLPNALLCCLGIPFQRPSYAMVG